MKDVESRVMAALLDDNNPTLTAVASAAGVSRRCVYDYLQKPDFARAYQQQREAQAVRRADQLEAKREGALKVIVTVMNDATQPGAVRLKAASQLLSEANAAQATVDAISKSKTFGADFY